MYNDAFLLSPVGTLPRPNALQLKLAELAKEINYDISYRDPSDLFTLQVTIPAPELALFMKNLGIYSGPHLGESRAIASLYECLRAHGPA